MVGKIKISQIVACGINGEIGKDNELLWDLKSDLKRFKDITMGKCMIMGRKTFESIGKPLNGRISIVVSRKERVFPYQNNLFWVKSIDEAFDLVKNMGEKEVTVIGGSQIYEQTNNVTDRFYITKVWKHYPDADSIYKIDTHNLSLVSNEFFGASRTGEDISYSFFTYDKK